MRVMIINDGCLGNCGNSRFNIHNINISNNTLMWLDKYESSINLITNFDKVFKSQSFTLPLHKPLARYYDPNWYKEPEINSITDIILQHRKLGEEIDNIISEQRKLYENRLDQLINNISLSDSLKFKTLDYIEIPIFVPSDIFSNQGGHNSYLTLDQLFRLHGIHQIKAKYFGDNNIGICFNVNRDDDDFRFRYENSCYDYLQYKVHISFFIENDSRSYGYTTGEGWTRDDFYYSSHKQSHYTLMSWHDLEQYPDVIKEISNHINKYPQFHYSKDVLHNKSTFLIQ